jgi:HEAT repeat protein
MRWIVVGLLLTLTGCGGEVDQSVEQLQSDDAGTRASGARKLGEMQGERAVAVPALVEALDDPDADVRRISAFALGEIGKDANAAVPALVETLEDPAEPPNVRFAAAFAVVQIDPLRTEPAPVLADAVRRHEPRAAVALGLMGPAAKDGVPALAAALASPRAIMRRQAALALAKIGPAAKDALPAVRRATGDPDTQVREAAVRAEAAIVGAR